MELLNSLAPAVQAALLHGLTQALWQGAMFGLAAVVTLALMARRSAAARHLVAMAFLMAMLVAPAWSFFTMLADPGGSAATSGTADPSHVPALTLPAIGALASAASWSPPVWLAWAWEAGVLMMLARLAGGGWLLSVMRQRPTIALPAPWPARVEALRQAMGIARPVRVRLMESIALPFASQLLRPMIWLPATMLTRLAPEQIEALIAHELAHIHRLDWLWNGLQCAIEALLFFHPAVWWLSGRVRQERESACDDMAAAACGDSMLVAEALLALEGLRCPTPRLALAAAGGSLRQRIERLLGSAAPRGLPWAASAALAALFCTGALLAQPVEPASAPRSAEPAKEAWSAFVGDSVHVQRTFDGHKLDYHRWTDLKGVHETYRVDGQSAPIDERARHWIDHYREGPPPPPSPPPMPPMTPIPSAPPMPVSAPPPPPPAPDISNDPAYQALLQQIQHDAQATALLGTPITIDGDCHPCRIDNDVASLHLTARGPKGNARIDAEGREQLGQWHFPQLKLRP